MIIPSSNLYFHYWYRRLNRPDNMRGEWKGGVTQYKIVWVLSVFLYTVWDQQLMAKDILKCAVDLYLTRLIKKAFPCLYLTFFCISEGEKKNTNSLTKTTSEQIFHWLWLSLVILHHLFPCIFCTSTLTSHKYA